MKHINQLINRCESLGLNGESFRDALKRCKVNHSSKLRRSTAKTIRWLRNWYKLTQQSRWALRFPNGTYYTGRVTSDERPNYHQGSHSEAFCFTYRGALHRCKQLPFLTCIIEDIKAL